jgi:hypothetical protein
MLAAAMSFMKQPTLVFTEASRANQQNPLLIYLARVGHLLALLMLLKVSIAGT